MRGAEGGMRGAAGTTRPGPAGPADAFFANHGIYADHRGVVNELEEGRRVAKALGPAPGGDPQTGRVQDANNGARKSRSSVPGGRAAGST